MTVEPLVVITMPPREMCHPSFLFALAIRLDHRATHRFERQFVDRVARNPRLPPSAL
jgi:hypothetical protein